MDQEGLHKEAFWIYGVVVGLAIREALVHTVPHFHSAPPALESWAIRLEAWRLLVFLVVTVRFYLGAVTYFHEVHIGDSAGQYPKKNFGLDFLTSLFHFLFFFAWATTIGIHGRSGKLGASLFLGLMAWILLFDLFWALLSWGYSTVQRMALWTAVNVVTVLFGLLVLLLFTVSEGDPVLAEGVVLGLVALVSVLDLSEIIRKKHFFAPLLAKLLPPALRPTHNQAL